MDSSSSSPGSQPNAERPNVHNMTFHEIIARYKERYERTIYFYIKATHDDGSVTEITNLPMVARLNGQIIDFNTLDLQSVQIDERHLVEKKDSEGHHTVITKDSRLEDMGTYLCKGEETTLECTVVGKPGPEVVWKKDGVPVNVDQSCVNSNKDRKSHHTVVIKNAVNKTGTAETTAPLNFPKSGFERVEEGAVEPFFVEPLKPAQVTEGDTVILKCRVNKEP